MGGSGGEEGEKEEKDDGGKSTRDDRARSSKRGRTNKQQEGDQKVKMLARGNKGAIEEEVLRFCKGGGGWGW